MQLQAGSLPSLRSLTLDDVFLENVRAILAVCGPNLKRLELSARSRDHNNRFYIEFLALISDKVRQS